MEQATKDFWWAALAPSEVLRDLLRLHREQAAQVAQLTRYIETLVMVLYARNRLNDDDLATLRGATEPAPQE